MKFVLALAAVLILASTARADTLQVFSDQVAVGQPYGLELCDYSCGRLFGPQAILEQVSFVNTGIPETASFAATDANVDQMIAYLLNPNPDPNTYIHIIGDGDYFGGH